jgi:hypothetical protein
MVTVLKSVSRIRLVKTENTSVSVTVNCNALYCVRVRAECISTINPIQQSHNPNAWQCLGN